MMKNKFAVKASLFTLILALLAICTYAASVVMKKNIALDLEKAVDPEWYQYDGSGDPTDASNYTLVPPEDVPTLCPGTQEICAVRAMPGSPSQPDTFSDELKEEIENAIASSTPSTNVKLHD